MLADHGPPRDRVEPQRSCCDSSFSGMRPTEISSVSHGHIPASARGCGCCCSSTGATVTFSTRRAAVDLDDRGRQVQRNIEVVQALHDVAVEAVGVRHDLEDAGHLDPFQGQAPRHDQPDVARAEDGDTAAGQHAVQVDEALRQPGREDPGRPCAGDADGGPRPFARAHGQHHGARLHQRDACLRSTGS